jgi:hydroxymethylglutaryl-CoA lyase
VTIVEVGPRDGLQAEPDRLPLDARVEFVRALARAGLTRIEAAAFVHPGKVPQMAQAEELFLRLADLVASGTRLSALVPNRKGLDRALSAGVTEIAVVASATETFNRRNLDASIDETLAEIDAVARAAAVHGLPVRGYLSVAFVCPYEGRVRFESVVRVTRRLLEAGVFEVALSDTIGAATPRDVAGLLDAVAPHLPIDRTAFHLHDTRGTALANVIAALERGVSTFDASAGGLGGCPFAPGALGNLATEDLVYLLDGLGIVTGVSLDALVEASRGIEGARGRPLVGRVYRAGGAPRPAS